MYNPTLIKLTLTSMATYLFSSRESALGYYNCDGYVNINEHHLNGVLATYSALESTEYCDGNDNMNEKHSHTSFPP